MIDDRYISRNRRESDLANLASIHIPESPRSDAGAASAAIALPTPCPSSTRTYVDKTALEAELQDLCGTASNGALDRAWKAFEEKAAKAPSPLPSIRPQEAKLRFEELLARRLSLLASIEALNALPQEARTEEAGYRAELSRLEGDSMNGEIDRAWKTYEAADAKGHYEALEARRIVLQEQLSSIETRSYTVLSPAVVAVVAAVEDRHPPHRFTTVEHLIGQATAIWNPDAKYEGIPYDENNFKALCRANNAMFPLSHNPETDFGCIEKRVVEPNTQIFVRADLHGDLKSLTENLISLQKQGLLDETFKCRPKVQLVFLGDYCDRGENTMEVLQLLITLRMENPDQVTLIRGNHESILMNVGYGASDTRFKSFLSQEGAYSPKVENQALLTGVFDTLNLASFIGERTDTGKIQYTMFTHGLFELYANIHSLLNSSEAPTAKMPIPKVTIGHREGVRQHFSGRIQNMPFNKGIRYVSAMSSPEYAPHTPLRKKLKLEYAAKRIRDLADNDLRTCEDVGLSAFNWGDMSISEMGSNTTKMGSRYWKICPQDVKFFLRLNSSENHKVKLIFRGHEHLKQHHSYEGKVVVTTLPVGMDSRYQQAFPSQVDTAYVLTTKPKVKEWLKKGMLRIPGTSDTTVSERACVIGSSEV